MSPFCKLLDPSSYVACAWDLSRDVAGAAHWAVFFKRHLETILALGAAAARERGESGESVDQRADACRREFHEIFDRFAASTEAHQRVTILTLVHWRDGTLRKHGFVDAFVDLKARENEKMLPMLGPLCREIDAMGNPREQLPAIIEGVFAGNIFDMGAEATAKVFLAESPPAFLEVRAKLPRRPWLIDDYDRLESRLLEGPPYRKAVYFIDNAGSDFLLGALPMMRWLARRGTHVVLAANEGPTLNDMTIHDVRAWWPRILEAEPSLASLPIEPISTGTAEPLIDLSAVSDKLNAASADADLVILEGMGRGVESNLDARFSCDALNIAMLKDDAVANRVGGKVFDLVCRFR
jgi:uncharacterized protein with ATP-grasp and redox domains